MSEQEFVWMPKDLAEKYKKLTEDGLKLDFFSEIMEKTRESMKIDIECLDDDIVRFRNMLLSYKKNYKEALEAHKDSVYQIWEEIDKETPGSISKAQQLADSIQKELIGPLKETKQLINDLCKSIENIRTHELTKMMELIDNINHMSDTSKEVLLKVLEFKKENK